MADRKGSWVQLSQSPQAAPVTYRRLSQAEILQLRAPDDPVLTISQFGNQSLHLASL